MAKNTSVSDIREKSARGIKWQVSTEILARLLQLLITFALARLLTPDDFGLIGMALIFTQLAFVLFDLGLSSALIQKKDMEPDHAQTAQTVFAMNALFFYLIVFFSAPYIALFFHQPKLNAILRLLAVVFFLFAIRAIANVQLTRAMRFKTIGLIRLVSVLIYGALAVTLAWQKFGVWSFVLGIVGQELILTVLTVASVKTFVWPGWNPQKLKELTSFGGQVLGSRIMGYLNINLPNAIIGRFMGSAVLGYYSVGYQLVDFPVQRISKNILRVMFPAFSKIQDKLPQYQQLYKDTVSGLALAVFPIFAGMALVAPEFVTIFYGPKWKPLITVLEILTVVGLARSIWVTTSVVFLSKGKPKWELLINAIYFVILSVVLYLIYTHGLIVVVTAISLLLLFFVGIALVVSLRLIQLRLTDWLSLIKTPTFATIAFSLVLIALRFTGINQLPALFRLVLMIVIGGLVYVLTVYLLDRQAFQKFKMMAGKSS